MGRQRPVEPTKSSRSMATVRGFLSIGRRGPPAASKVTGNVSNTLKPAVGDAIPWQPE
jgi:hypothetical protein